MPQSLQKIRILILTALPQEYSPLKRLFPSWRMIRKRPPKKFAFDMPGKEIILIESGMGEKAVREVLGAELTGAAPDLLIFSGFAGGLHPDLPVGVACFAASTRKLPSGAEFHFRFPDELADFLAQNNVRPVLALSAETSVNKQDVPALASGRPAVLDMETAIVAEIASINKIPFICFRAISDAIGHDLGFDLSDITDGRGGIRLAGVLSTVIRKPSTLKAFYLSWRRSRRAAKNLCGSLASFLEIPAFALVRMTSSVRWTVESGV